MSSPPRPKIVPSLLEFDDGLRTLEVLFRDKCDGRVGPYIATGSAGPKVSVWLLVGGAGLVEWGGWQPSTKGATSFMPSAVSFCSTGCCSSVVSFFFKFGGIIGPIKPAISHVYGCAESNCKHKSTVISNSSPGQ